MTSQAKQSTRQSVIPYSYEYMKTHRPSGRVTARAAKAGSVIITTTTTENRSSPDTKAKDWYENAGKRIILSNYSASTRTMTSVSGIRWVRNYRDGNYDIENGDTGAQAQSYINPVTSVNIPNLGSIIRDLETVAMNSALAEANSAEWDVATFLGEAPETIAYLGGKLQSLANLLSSKGRRRIVKRLKKPKKPGATDRWLEYRYAIMPMLYDMDDALKALNFMYRGFRTARGKANYSSSIDNTQIQYGVTHKRTVGSYECLVRAAIYSIFTEEQEARLRYGFWLPSAAWEITKMSFVVDWAIGIGDALAALRPVQYIERKATLSTRERINLETTSEYHPGNSEYALISSDASAYYSLDSYNRRVVTPQTSLPRINVNMNWKRCLDAFALSWPLIKRMLRRAR